MSTNPNNAVGTNGAFGGRTSVNAFNDVLGVFKSRGIVSGWGIVPDSGMDVAVGGDGSTRDVAIAEDNIGNKTTVNNISQQPVTVSIPAAPASNSRIDLIVAYVDNPAQGVATETDNYGACGLIVVSGAAAANPVAPDESEIRTAITTDGGAGSVAYYVVLGSVTVASGTTDISSNMISAGAFAAVKSDNVELGTLLWSAPNPQGTPATTWQVNTQDYEYFRVAYRRLGNVNTEMMSELLYIPKGSTGSAMFTIWHIFSDAEVRFRTIFLTRTTLQAQDGQYRPLLSTAVSQKNDAYCVPTALYGIK